MTRHPSKGTCSVTCLLPRQAKRRPVEFEPCRTVGSVGASGAAQDFPWFSDTLHLQENTPLAQRFSEAAAVSSSPVQTKGTRTWLRPGV